MTQYVINIGTIPNDGTGDPLRTAFNETNLNFDQVFAAGPVLSNVRIANNTILTTNTNGNLILAPNGVGVVQANVNIVPNTSNIRNLGSADRRWSSLYVQYANISGNLDLAGIFTVADLSVIGNLTVTGNTIQIGNLITDAKTIQLANTAGTANAANGSGITVGANDNIATFIYGSGTNRWNTNIGLNVNGGFSANVAGNIWSFNGEIMSAPTGATWSSQTDTLDEYISSAADGYINMQSLYANGNVASQIHLEHGLAQIVVDNGSSYIWGFDDSGNLTLPGNTFAVNYANGTAVVLGGTYGNANVATFLANFGSNTISTTGNVNTGRLSVTGNITANSAGNIWSISNDTLNFPSGASWRSDKVSLDEYITSAANGYLNLQTYDNTVNVATELHMEHGVIQFNIYNGSSKTWNFNEDGTTNVPGNIIPNTSNTYTLGNATNQWNSLSVSAWNISGNTLSAPSGATWNSNVVSLDEYITSANNGYIDLQSIQAGNVASAVHLEHGLAQIIANTGSSQTWTFDDAGNLTTPGGLIINGNINTLGSQTALLQSIDDLPLAFIASGANGSVTSFWAEDFANLMTSNIAAIYTPLQNTQTVRIVTGSNGGNIAIYDFDPDGMFTAAAVCATGNVYAGNVSASGNVTGGNILTGGLVSAIGNVIAGNVNTGKITLTNGAVIKDTAGNAVAFGYTAGQTSQGDGAVAIGTQAGQITQGQFAVAIGDNAGNNAQGTDAVAIGASAGLTTQGNGAVALGQGTGETSQGANAVALGKAAGQVNQGINSIAIGQNAGLTNQGNNTIILNATGSALDQTTANTFTVAPVRNDVANTAQVLFYNTTSKEITYGNVISVAGNVTGGNLITAGSGGNITMTGGNITGANVVTANSFVGNGATLSNVATQVTGSWTVPVGNSTQSFTVPINNMYQLWVLGNIPNGIIVYNATVSVSNTNVPVIGQQFAWNYEGGGNILMFTSIPAQIVGTAGTISNAAPAVANTNVFTFGINNTSGNTVTVNYGYTKIS